jgi:plastocyanin
MHRHTLIAAAVVLAAATTPIHAGPGCKTGGKHPMGWYPQQHMAAPGYNGYGQMPRYGYGSPGRAMMRPQYSPVPMMAGARQPGYYAPQTAAANSQADRGESGSGDVDAENITVRIKGMRFEPASVTVKPGTTVTWIQEDGAPHTVTGTGGELRSDTLMGGQRFSHTFPEAGSFDYACNFHPMMKGTVVVSDSAS